MTTDNRVLKAWSGGVVNGRKKKNGLSGGSLCCKLYKNSTTILYTETNIILNVNVIEKLKFF